MISYATTSIIDSAADVLVCPVNTVGVMGKGLALEFKRRFPLTSRHYVAWCKDPPPGSVILLARTLTEKRCIVFLPTKNDWRHPSDLGLIESGLTSFANAICVGTPQKNGLGVIQSVAFPKLGCGLGQLDWKSKVQPLMERTLAPLPIAITIHLFP